MLNYAGFKDTTFESVCPLKDNEERQWRNKWLYVGVRSFVFYALIAPLHYFVKPLLIHCWEHKLEVALIALPFMFAPYVPVAVLAVLVIAALFASLMFVLDLIADITFTLGELAEVEMLGFHKEIALREPSLDMYESNATAVFTFSQIQAYQERYGFFSSGILKAEAEVEVTDSQARIYEAKQIVNIMANYEEGSERDALMAAEHDLYLSGLSRGQ